MPVVVTTGADLQELVTKAKTCLIMILVQCPVNVIKLLRNSNIADFQKHLLEARNALTDYVHNLTMQRFATARGKVIGQKKI